jgi:hypothetical protein
VLQRSASYIGIGLANLVNLLNPKVVIFGGALFREIPQLIADPLRRIIKQRSLEKSAQEVQLVVSTLGGEASALGAARLIAEGIMEDLYLHWSSGGVGSTATSGVRRANDNIAEKVEAEDNVATR